MNIDASQEEVQKVGLKIFSILYEHTFAKIL